MSTRTLLLTFKLDVDVESGLNTIQTLLQKYFPSLTEVKRVPLAGHNFLVIYSSASGDDITFILRYYAADKLFTINGDVNPSSSDFKMVRYVPYNRLVDELRKELNIKSIEAIPVLKRNNAVPRYFLSSDFNIREYDFDKVVVDEKSSFQDIKILHSPTLGNALILDDMQNLAEADLSYTHGLMNFGKVSYKDKDILILGGGDGALLHELLKESPKFVTMVDIDELVMKHCQKHLRGACGDTLDNYQGEKYRVIVDDCVKYLRDYIKEGRTFDVVFNDLTDIPISDKDNLDLIDNNQDKWTFVKEILELSMQVLKAGGIYLNHATGAGSVSALDEYEELLKKLPYKLQFSRHSAFVPSFLEEWIFYQINKVA